MKEDIIKTIKQNLRLSMNGLISSSMRAKGAAYKVNWGLTLPELKRMAQQYDKDETLASELWKEEARECKILATLLMPAEKMALNQVRLWINQLGTVEMAEISAMTLFSHLPYAADLAYRCIASPVELTQICGYHILTRLFRNHQEPNARGINEFIDEAMTAVQSQNISLRRAANNCLHSFALLGLVYERIRDTALRRSGLSKPS